MDKRYKICNGTYYSSKTNDEVISVLEQCRLNKTKIVLDYGDSKGRSWNDVSGVTGIIKRSTGIIKIPILIYNERGIGDCTILDHCIIGIKESRGGKILYSFVKK